VKQELQNQWKCEPERRANSRTKNPPPQRKRRSIWDPNQFDFFEEK